MRWLISLIFIPLISLQASFANDNAYKLAAGDVIQIKVYAEPDLSFEKIKLTENGNFNYPFVGEIDAKGLTAFELQDKITNTLKGDFLVDPRVSVSVVEYRQFFISGEVKNPAGYPYQPGLTIRRAITLAGGLTERASERKITIVREEDEDKEPKYVDLDDIVMPGDSVNIGQGFF